MLRHLNRANVLLAGNGGSAADSQHIAGEFVSRFLFDRPGLPAIALTTDTSILKAIGNDYGFEKLFSRQIQALANEGDVFIAYSTSGSSPNVLRAIEQAKEMRVIGMTGNRKSEMNSKCDVLIQIQCSRKPKNQEGHLVVGHIICQIVEREILDRDMSDVIILAGGRGTRLSKVVNDRPKPMALVNGVHVSRDHCSHA